MKKIQLKLRSDSSVRLVGEHDVDAEKLKAFGFLLPTKDLKFFKGIYAVGDEFNGNGHKLPSEEIEASLQSLVGKSVNLEHEGNSPIGFYFDVSYNGKDMESSAVLWSSLFPEQVKQVEAWIEEDDIGQSFELDCKNLEADGTVRGITFTAGAILRRSKAACPDTSGKIFANKKKSTYWGNVLGDVLTDEGLVKLTNCKILAQSEKAKGGAMDELLKRLSAEDVSQEDIDKALEKVKAEKITDDEKAKLSAAIEEAQKVLEAKDVDKKKKEEEEKKKKEKKENKAKAELKLSKEESTALLQPYLSEIATLKIRIHDMEAVVAEYKELEAKRVEAEKKEKEEALLKARREELKQFKEFTDEEWKEVQASVLDDKEYKTLQVSLENASLKAQLEGGKKQVKMLLGGISEDSVMGQEIKAKEKFSGFLY